MKIKNVYCLFEQSGTFKNELKALGVNAEDYDIKNDFGETDHHLQEVSKVCGLCTDKEKVIGA